MHYLIEVGKSYPSDFGEPNAAYANFFSPFNTLLIKLEGIDQREKKAFKKGRIDCVLLQKNGGILLIWRFYDSKNRPVITLESPFDARVIEKPALPNIQSSNERLVIDVHVVNSSNNLVVAIRTVTMPAELTVKFLSAVHDQLSSRQGDVQINLWLSQSIDALYSSHQAYKMGT